MDCLVCLSPLSADQIWSSLKSVPSNSNRINLVAASWVLLWEFPSVGVCSCHTLTLPPPSLSLKLDKTTSSWEVDMLRSKSSKPWPYQEGIFQLGLDGVGWSF